MLCVCVSPQVSFSGDPALQLTPLSLLTVEFNSENSSLPNHYKDLIQTHTYTQTNNDTHMHSQKERHRQRERK